jgi:uncharacterized membrane protein YkgB
MIERMDFPRFDAYVLRHVRRWASPLARFSLFVIFFWFGVLKLLGVSPADPLVAALLGKTMPFVPFTPFRIFFGLYEMAIGAAFVVLGFERLAIALLLPHMAMTFLPLIFLTDLTWHSILVPTFAGQYIIKNLVIIALALSLAAHLHRLPEKE